MQLVILLSILMSTLAGAIAGVRLLVISRRTHKVPELAIGIGLIGFVIGQCALTGIRIMGGKGSELQISLLVFLATSGLVVSLLALSIFMWRVFGEDSIWRRILTGTLWIVGLVGGFGTFQASTAHLTGGPAAPVYWRLSVNLSFVVLFCWMSLEALSYHRLMRKRLLLGLADPVVVNRFLVWGLGSGLCVLCVLAGALLYLTNTLQDVQGPLFGVPVAAAGFVNSITWWLTFFPPGRYLDWVRGPAKLEAGNG